MAIIFIRRNNEILFFENFMLLGRFYEANKCFKFHKSEIPSGQLSEILDFLKIDFSKIPPNLQVVESVKDAVSVQPARVVDEPVKPRDRSTLTHMSFAISGKIDGYTRDEIKKLIEQYGGILEEEITENTNYFVNTQPPDKRTRKVIQAERYGTTILSKNSFKKMLGII